VITDSDSQLLKQSSATTASDDGSSIDGPNILHPSNAHPSMLAGFEPDSNLTQRIGALSTIQTLLSDGLTGMRIDSSDPQEEIARLSSSRN
jgi:hypothetical protein